MRERVIFCSGRAFRRVRRRLEGGHRVRGGIQRRRALGRNHAPLQTLLGWLRAVAVVHRAGRRRRPGRGPDGLLGARRVRVVRKELAQVLEVFLPVVGRLLLRQRRRGRHRDHEGGARGVEGAQ